MPKQFKQFLNEANQLQEMLDKSTIQDVAHEVATAVDEGGGWDRMSEDDILEIIGLYLEDIPGAEMHTEKDIKKIYRAVASMMPDGDKKDQLRKDIPTDMYR